MAPLNFGCSRVTRCLPRCCTPVIQRRTATCNLMVMQETRNKNKGLEGGNYARTEEELYKKAIALLEKCKIETRHTGQEMPEPELAT
jgi:hypothetical protein